MKKLFYMDLHAYISYLFSAYIFLRQRVQNKESNKTWFFKNIIVCWFVKLLCHFLTFLFHRVLWDLSVIPTEHTLESETNTYIHAFVHYFPIWWSPSIYHTLHKNSCTIPFLPLCIFSIMVYMVLVIENRYGYLWLELSE